MKTTPLFLLLLFCATGLLRAETEEEIFEVVQRNFGTVERDSSGRIVAVDLAGGRTSVDDADFERVLRLPNLKKLSVSGAGLSPETLALLENAKPLEELFLQDTRTTDVELKRLVDATPNMTRIRLRRLAGLTDTGIAELRRWKKLRVVALLDLPGVTGNGLKSIAQSKTITSLDLRNCTAIAADDYRVLSEMKQLTELKIGGFTLNDSVLDVVQALPKLNSFTLEDAMISRDRIAAMLDDPGFAARTKSLAFARMPGAVNDAVLAKLKRFTALKSLSLKQIPVNGAFLADCPPLESLTLDRAILRPQAFDELAKMQTLKRLNLSGVMVSTKSLEKLAALESLESLDLSGCQLRNEMLAPLRRIPRLKEVRLDDNPNLTETL